MKNVLFIYIWHYLYIIAVDCKEPNPIENGRVITMNGTTTYNNAVEYHCIPQYERIGPYLRKCMETGKWSGEEPRCECKYLFTFIFFVCNNLIFLVTIEEPQDSSGLGTTIGISAGVVLFLLILLGLIYMKL